jgi:hypothetical protein
VPRSRGRHRSRKSTRASKTKWMMSGECHLHKYLLIRISQGSCMDQLEATSQPLSRSACGCAACRTEEEYHAVVCLGVWICCNQQNHVSKLLRNKGAHVMLYLRSTKLLSSRIVSKPNTCAEGASTGKQKEFVDPYLADDSYRLTHQHPHSET